ncbi:hypothetical protein [Sphaerochaeta halotolerans]|nr:hypothetical protein [Sphaerochaeta halotolerans]
MNISDLQTIQRIRFDYSNIDKLDFPRLYRFFSKNEYAESFFKGKILLSNINKYKEIEGVRKDKSEGLAEYKQKVLNRQGIKITGDGKFGESVFNSGTIDCSSFILNQYYILCFSQAETEEEIAYLHKKFSCQSKYIAITDVKLFTQKVLDALEEAHFESCISSGKWYRVEYTKGNELDYESPPFELSIFQKDQSYSDEKEWRLGFCMKDRDCINSHDSLVIDNNEYAVFKKIAEKFQLTKHYFQDKPNHRDEFKNEFWEAEWKTDLSISLKGMEECCELLFK